MILGKNARNIPRCYFLRLPPPLPSWRVILLALVIARLNTTRYDD